MPKSKDKKDTVNLSDPKLFDCEVRDDRTIACKVKDMDTFKKVTAMVPKKIEFTLNDDVEDDDE